jgi:hypothetical protein
MRSPEMEIQKENAGHWSFLSSLCPLSLSSYLALGEQELHVLYFMNSSQF